jgi:hypothetical protein
MSHFSQIKTQLRNLTSLKAALSDLDVGWKAGPCEVKGYQGQTHTAEVAIQQDNGFDVGFSWNGQEYALVADLQYWQQPWSVDGFLSRVTQRYAYHTVITSGVEQGFHVAQQQEAADGSVRVVLQRWSA